MLYAISDIHGDIDRATEMLRANNVIDSDLNWIAGTNTLVNCGDMTDRGRNGVAVIKLLHDLSRQAEDAGGSVISLKGNHDAIMTAVTHMLISPDSCDSESEIIYWFRRNGGYLSEAEELARPSNRTYFNYLMHTQAMVRLGDVLFQHVDGWWYYDRIVSGKSFDTPDDRIAAINLAMFAKSRSIMGCYDLFEGLTNDREWNYQGPDDLQVVHGHTRHLGTEPMTYMKGLAINIDGTLSNGYRSDADRGCMLVLP